MAHVNSLIAVGLSLATVVALMGVGAFLLRNAAKDASEIASSLPTRFLAEDTSEARESNRRKALLEMLGLLALRSAPGAVLIIGGVCFLFWICLRLLPISDP
jgi:hypothetical protein